MFPLAALGAGLGQFAQQYQQQQEAAIRQQMLALTLARYQNELQQQRDQREGSSAEWASIMGAGGPATPPMQPMQSMQSMQSMPSGGMLPSSPVQQPQDFGSTGGVGPRISRAALDSPSLAGGAPISGPGNRPGMAGSAAAPGTPLPGNIPPPRQDAASAQNYGAMSGKMSPLAAVPQLADAGATAMGGQSGAAPQQGGNFDPIRDAAAQIEQMMPTASAQAKMAALTARMKLYNPEIQRQFRDQMQAQAQQHALDKQAQGFLFSQQLKDQQAQATLDRVQTQAEAKEKLAQESYGWEVRTDKDGTDYRYNRRTGQAKALVGDEPYTPSGASKTGTAGSGGGRKSEQIDVTDPDSGKSIFSGLAHEIAPGKWVSSSDNTPIDTAGKKMMRTPLSMGITSQNIGNRISMGANEVARSVENMTAMPIGTTLGWFSGSQALAPKELGQAIRRNLANKVTPEGAQMLTAMSRGVERGLGILAAAGAATGLVTLQESLKQEMPQENDTGFTILTKYANMRQLVEAANDTIQASTMVADPQKKQMQVNTDRITKAVPWTVSQVIQLATDPDDESVASFAQKMGLGGQPKAAQSKAASPGGQPAAPAISPPAEAVSRLRANPTADERKMFDEVFGAGAAARSLGR